MPLDATSLNYHVGDDACAQYVMLYNDEPDMVTLIPDDTIVVDATGMVSPEFGVDWVGPLKDGRKLTINGTDGSVLPMPYQDLTGSLHKATALGSDQIWINSSADKEKAT
ncbi:hypothetical protein E4U13_002784 [Claviceps humidiphila]|uniref:Uncharacterized protein n=1 Tax=Claviceps humidiphila TaxID=1294629 RepID=A0A9P7Q0K4_9HYPO|nr:hypothetical protein E4U13_002784 [Claviceps humidiphila]